ncbi:uncharacterized protein LOC129942508 [Eupeodes corollae]|uniref:uncharacterized protein LOC129942508 n=1 Tax=Eupeodes corollae TaxID=290404 RepID=UPI0024927F90|nr:uncharacterized protein LOC129942508 [Eupeodes corollae]
MYIIPVYINCNKWAQDFSSLYNFLLEFEKEDLMIIGDFNGRVGNSQILNEEPEFLPDSIKNVRSATDEVLDGNGKKLVEMCESIGLTLLNGRTNGDTNGNFTFIRGTACSTIDYCLAKGIWLKYIADFIVNELTYSDHLPISVQVDIKLQQDSQPKQQYLLPKLRWYERDLQKYTANLNLNVSLINETDLQSIWGSDILTSCIMESAKPLQKKTVKIALVNIKDSRSFWKTAKVLNGALFLQNIKVEAGELATHFKKLLNPPPNPNPMEYALPYQQDIFLDRSILLEEVTSVIHRCGLNKAPGEDRISYEFFKNASTDFLVKLTSTFNFIWSTGEVPDSFKKSVILPILKKGDPRNPSNYRGISFLNTVMKIFTGILLQRLTDWINENDRLSEFQAGFRKGYSTVDNIFSLTSIARMYVEKGKKLYAFFVDFKAAFDCIDRRSLFLKLSNLGVSTKMLRIFQKLYEENKSAVWDGNSLSNWFEPTTGVKQGCLLSPLLFSIYLDDLVTVLPGGVPFDGMSLKILLYADDIVVLSESPNMLQIMINKLPEENRDLLLTAQIYPEEPIFDDDSYIIEDPKENVDAVGAAF